MIVFKYKVLLTINYIFLQAILHYMNSKQIFILIIFLPFFVNGQFNDKKSYEIKKIEDAPIIDGNMNDNIWTELNIARDFTQISPNNGSSERPNQKTEVKICYDNKNIYFGVMMYDNYPDSILKELAVRDNKNANADQFAIYIDPFSNGQVEYELMVSAAGVQSDAKITTSSVDKSWDAVWNSSVKINDNGWFLEISIPFSQLRFPENIDYWSINMARGIRRYREDYSWNPINVEFSDFSLQAGILNVKLRYIQKWNNDRKIIASKYNSFLSTCQYIKLPKKLNKCDHVYHLYVIQTQKRDELQRYLSKNGIGTSIHYPIPPHLQKAYSGLKFKKGDFPIAEILAKTSLSLPIYPGLSDSEIQYICDTITKFFKN